MEYVLRLLVFLWVEFRGGGGQEQRSHMYSLAGYIYIMSANMSFKTLKNMQFLPGRVYILILVFALV